MRAAYECLSDVNERAWYDGHREAILRAGGGGGGEAGAYTRPRFSSTGALFWGKGVRVGVV